MSAPVADRPSAAVGQDRSSAVGTERPSAVGSVANAARVLKAFTPQNPDWGVTELARHLGLAKSTAFRLLSTLADESLLEQDPITGRYRLGLAVFDLAAAVLSPDLHEAALTAMSELRHATGETVQVAVLDGREVVYVERLDSHHTMRMFLEVGRRNWAHCSGCGKALLAHLPTATLERLYAGWELPAKTPRSITSFDVLRSELEDVRRRGWATNRGESAIDVLSLAAPIRTAGGRVIAALSVAGPLERVHAEESAFAQAVTRSATAISQRLGYRRSSGAA